jgi:hypothetical protein
MEISLHSQDTRALSHFRANADIVTVVQGDLQRQNSRWEVEWQLEGGSWKIIDVRSLDPYSDRVLPLMPAGR